MNWLAMIFAAAFLCALIYALYTRRQTVRVMKGLDDMLAKAMEGDFSEEGYDESVASMLENKFARYLSASQTSLRGVREERERIKSLVSDISHQTRTPVANIKLYAQLLSEKGLEGEAGECCAAMEAQAQKLEDLIEALVKTSRLESGILALHTAPGALEDIVLKAAEQYRLKAAEKHISFEVRPSCMTALCDAKWTGEALCILMDNAVKYTPQGGKIEVSMTAYEMFCRVDVKDTGVGIPEDEQPKIFGRFYRGRGVLNEQGVGIGLYLARQIASGEGGYIKVSSVQGQGSIFSLFIPRNEM